MKFSISSSAWKELIAWALPIWLLVLAVDGQAGALEPSQTEAMRWLTEMRQSVTRLNYKGVIAYLKDKQVESFQFFHAVALSGLEQERLVSMNSPLREMIRSAEKVACYFPENKTVFVENRPTKRSVFLDLPDDLSRLFRFYRANLRGQEYVARRLSQVISIEPRDDYRYARRIWMDLDSKLPLKIELLDQDGQVIEQMVFTSFSIEDAIPREDLEPSVQSDAFVWQISQREVLPLDSMNWTLQDVPMGFQIVSYTRLKRPPADRSAEHILLSDGFSSVSISIEEQTNSLIKSRPKKIGAVHTHSRKIDGHSVTVMGEVPAKTVEVIAHGLRYQGKNEP